MKKSAKKKAKDIVVVKKVKETRSQKLTRWMVGRYFPGMAIYKKVERPNGIKRKKVEVVEVRNENQG